MYVYPQVKTVRKERNLKQAEVAELLGTTQKQYSRWERGESEIPCHIIVRLAKYYGTTTDHLLSGGRPAHSNG